MCLEQSEPIRNGFGEIKPDHKQDLIKSVGDRSFGEFTGDKK